MGACVITASCMRAGFLHAAKALRPDDDRLFPSRTCDVPAARPPPREVERLHSRPDGHGHSLLCGRQRCGGHLHWRGREGLLVLDSTKGSCWEGKMSRAFCSQVMCSRKAFTDAARRVQRESQGCCRVNPAFRRGIASTGTVREATNVACGGAGAGGGLGVDCRGRHVDNPLLHPFNSKGVPSCVHVFRQQCSRARCCACSRLRSQSQYMRP